MRGWAVFSFVVAALALLSFLLFNNGQVSTSYVYGSGQTESALCPPAKYGNVLPAMNDDYTDITPAEADAAMAACDHVNGIRLNVAFASLGLLILALIAGVVFLLKAYETV